MDTLPEKLKQPLVELLLSVADDKFILGHQSADWTGLGPILEEDIAFSALAQDDLAHASELYRFIAELTGRDADEIAFGRDADGYRCAALVEVSDESDWARAIVRQFFCDHFEQQRLGRLRRSSLAPLAALAARMLAEEGLAIGHADQWIVRLAQANDEARGRIQAALDTLAPLAPTLFESPAGLADVEAAGLFPSTGDSPFEAWSAAVRNIIEAAGLRISLAPLKPDFRGGRSGVHTDGFAELLAELSEVYREEPHAKW